MQGVIGIGARAVLWVMQDFLKKFSGEWMNRNPDLLFLLSET